MAMTKNLNRSPITCLTSISPETFYALLLRRNFLILLFLFCCADMTKKESLARKTWKFHFGFFGTKQWEKVAASGSGLFDSVELSRGWRGSARCQRILDFIPFCYAAVRQIHEPQNMKKKECCIRTLLLASHTVTSGKVVLWASIRHGRGGAATKMENWFTNLFVIGNINLVTDLILQNRVAAAAATHVCFACVFQVRNARRCASQSLQQHEQIAWVWEIYHDTKLNGRRL